MLQWIKDILGISQYEVLLQDINNKVDLIITKQENIMATIQELQAAVSRVTDAEDSVVVLLKGISQQLKDAQASGNPQAIADVIAKLDANTAKLSAAVVENTPSA